MKRGEPRARSTAATRGYVDKRVDGLRKELLEMILGEHPPPRSPRTITTGDAARILGVGKPHVARLAAAQGLGTKVGTRWRLDRGKVLALKARREP